MMLGSLARKGEEGRVSPPEQNFFLSGPGSNSKELQFRQYWQAWSSPSVISLGMFQTVGWLIGLGNVHRWVNPVRGRMHSCTF